MKKITIKDVAKDAGVSIASVSKVINRKGYIGKDTFEKVTASIEKLGYKVNANAQSLKSSKSNKIGVLISDISNYYLMSIAKEVEKTIRSLGYHMILLSHNDEKAIEETSLHILLEQQIAALVIIPTGGNAETIASFKKANIPVIAIDRQVDGLETDLIMDDNYQGSYESIRYLKELRHQRIGLVYGHRLNSIGRDRYQGAVDAINDFHLDFDPLLIKETNFVEETAYRATIELLRLPNPPTAIYSCNNTMTVGIIKAVREQQMKIPDDISIIAFGDNKQWELITPKMTLMTQPLNRIGIETAVLLKNRLTLKEKFATENIIIKPILQKGNSCKKRTGVNEIEKNSKPFHYD